MFPAIHVLANTGQYTPPTLHPCQLPASAASLKTSASLRDDLSSKSACVERNLFILSAGWGLISASFLTPDYDITFSNVKRENKYKHRRKKERYHDFNMLPDATHAHLVFFGGKDYLPLFSTLTKSATSTKTVFYNSQDVPEVPGCRLRHFETDANTNWHYLAVNAFLDGRL